MTKVKPSLVCVSVCSSLMMALPYREIKDPAYCFDQQSRLLSLRQLRLKQLSLFSAADLEKELCTGIRAQE